MVCDTWSTEFIKQVAPILHSPRGAMYVNLCNCFCNLLIADGDAAIGKEDEYWLSK